MRKILVVIQSILLTIVVLGLPMLLAGNFVYVVGIVLGMIPFVYLKKSSKKEVLKINLWSSLAALVLLLVVFSYLHFYLGAMFNADGGIGASGMSGIISIFDAANLLKYGLSFLGLFNVPFLIYYFFGKKDAQVSIQVPVQAPVAQVT